MDHPLHTERLIPKGFYPHIRKIHRVIHKIDGTPSASSPCHKCLTLINTRYEGFSCILAKIEVNGTLVPHPLFNHRQIGGGGYESTIWVVSHPYVKVVIHPHVGRIHPPCAVKGGEIDGVGHLRVVPEKDTPIIKASAPAMGQSRHRRLPLVLEFARCLQSTPF